jgi:hypothetical protein
MDRTLNQLMREFSEIAAAHRQIKEYFQGDFFDAISRDAAQYPLMVATLQPGSLGDGFVQVNVIITICDKYNIQEYRQINEIHSDCLSICNDIKITMQQYRWTEFSDINFTIATDPFIQRSQDVTAGWSMNVSLNVFDDGNWCDLPMDGYDFENGTPIHSNDCQPALVVNSDFTFSREIPSGDTFNLADIMIEVFDQNENLLSRKEYPAATNQQVTVYIEPCADATYDLYNTVPTRLQSGSIPSGENAVITAPDGQVQIKKQNDGTLSNEFVASGAVHEFIVNNNSITVNNSNGFTIHATDPLDIRIHNQNGNDITPQSVTYQGNQHYVTAVINTAQFVPVGAKIPKTGQTTSYATGDDGATQRGRSINFLKLWKDNPFGNNNRFTNKTGGSTFGARVAYDWSTFDGSTVLAYYWGDVTTREWAKQCTQYMGATIDGLRDWYLINFQEMNNILNCSLWSNYMLNYAPFNSTLRYYWISTNPAGTGGVATDLATAGIYISTSKSNPLYGMWTRVCTVNGTTIT